MSNDRVHTLHTNRLKKATRDYKLLIVKRPNGWRPRNHFEAPIKNTVLNEYVVASYEEAHDDLVRCNRLSLHQDLDSWAVIQSPEAASRNQAKHPDDYA